NLDGIPQYGPLIDAQMKKPFLMVYSARPGRIGSSDVVYRRAAAPYYRVDVRDTKHLDFSDMVFWPTLHDRGITGPMPAARAAARARASVSEYVEQELHATPSPVLTGGRREAEVTGAQFPGRPR